MVKRTATTHVLILLAFLASAAGFWSNAWASVWEKQDILEISRLHTIDDDLWAFAESFNLDGSVTGDVMSFAYQTKVSGKVNGSLHSFTRSFRMNGSIDGSARVFAQTIVLSGYIGRSVVAGAESFTLDDGAVIGRDASVWGSHITIAGTIRNNADLTGARIEIKGSIEGNAKLTGDRIVIMPPAVIQGNLVYNTKDSAAIRIEPGVTILGATTWEPYAEAPESKKSTLGTDILLSVASLLAAFLFGVIVVRIFRPYAEEAYKQLRTRTLASLATGVVSVFALFFCVLVLVVAIFSILAGTILIESGGLAVFGGPLLVLSILLVPITSFLSVSGAVILYSGKIIVAFAMGTMIFRSGSNQSPMRATSLLVGLCILAVVFAVPYVWLLAYVGVSVLGAGAIILGIRNCPRTHPPSA